MSEQQYGPTLGVRFRDRPSYRGVCEGPWYPLLCSLDRKTF